MLVPNLFNSRFFDDLFDDFEEVADLDRKLYGKHANREMLTDVHEYADHYEVQIDLPGFKKEDINLSLNNGYLTVSATKGLKEEDKDKKIVRQERFIGTLTRQFYVGENVEQEDIKAKYEDGVLVLSILKKENKQIAHKTIEIEG